MAKEWINCYKSFSPCSDLQKDALIEAENFKGRQVVRTIKNNGKDVIC